MPIAIVSVIAEIVTKAVPLVGMLWFIVSIFAPESAKIASRELSTPFLSRSSALNVTMLPGAYRGRA